VIGIERPRLRAPGRSGAAAITAAATVLAVCGLVGCDGGARADRLDKQEYLRQIRAIEASRAAQRASRLFFEIVVEPPLPQPICRARARELHRTLVGIVDRVEQLRPPSEVAGLQRQFVDYARESVRIVGQAAADVGAGQLRCGISMNRRIYGRRSTRRAQSVLREYAEHGYILGLNAPD
jgi:hypothetical protein